MRKDYWPLLIAAVALAVLPFMLDPLGLPLRSSIDVVVFAIACLGLNVLVGYTGLVSFGHGAWFGLGAYAAALSQLHWFPGASSCRRFSRSCSSPPHRPPRRADPAPARRLLLAPDAGLDGDALRRRVSLDGTHRRRERPWRRGARGQLGLDLSSDWTYYWVVAGDRARWSASCCVRFHRSPLGSVLVAIRENEQRARFLGYPTNRYKLVGFVISATVVGLAGVLSVFNHRFASAEPLTVAFSGELIAMVVIGGMRSFLGPALGALFYILFREFLSIWTPHWLFYFGILFVGFIMFSPTGLVGVAQRVMAPFRRKVTEEAAMAGRRLTDEPLPAFLRPPDHMDGVILEARGIAKSFGALKAVQGVDIHVRDRSLHALIGPNGAGKTTAFNLISGLYTPDEGDVLLEGHSVAGLSPEAITQAGIGRSFQITNLFPALTVEENIRLAVQARHPQRFDPWTAARSIDADRSGDRGGHPLSRGGWHRARGGGRALIWRAAAPRHGPRARDEAAGAAARRAARGPRGGRAPAHRRHHQAHLPEVPILLVEHDIDRVFQIADAVTVMNEGQVLVDGTVEDARSSPSVQEIYIGSGAATLAAKPRPSAAEPATILAADRINTFYGQSHILVDVSFDVHQHEIVALLGRNGAGKSTLLKTLTGIAKPASGSIGLDGQEMAGRPSPEIARLGIGYVPQGRGPLRQG